MDWDTFFVQRLADLGLKGAVSLLKHVSQNILLGIVNLRSELKSRLEQKRAETLIYDADELVDLWRHVYGRTWAWDAWRGDSIIHEGIRLELHSVTLHEYPSTKPGYRYCLPSEEYRRQAHDYFPHSYQNVDEELDTLYWGQQHQDIGILDIRYRSVLVGTKRRYLLGATAGEAEGSPSSFPVVVGERVYQQLAEGLRTYGAMRVEKITGKISIGDERFKPLFRREFYRDPLFLEADESRKIVLMDKPHQVLGDAWTVAELDGTAQILAFTFALGTIDWEERLKEQCWCVEKVCKEHGGYPLVDFDAQRRRFTTARLYPEAIEGWYDQIIERLILRSDPILSSKR